MPSTVPRLAAPLALRHRVPRALRAPDPIGRRHSASTAGPARPLACRSPTHRRIRGRWSVEADLLDSLELQLLVVMKHHLAELATAIIAVGWHHRGDQAEGVV